MKTKTNLVLIMIIKAFLIGCSEIDDAQPGNKVINDRLANDPMYIVIKESLKENSDLKHSDQNKLEKSK